MGLTVGGRVILVSHLALYKGEDRASAALVEKPVVTRNIACAIKDVH